MNAITTYLLSLPIQNCLLLSFMCLIPLVFMVKGMIPHTRVGYAVVGFPGLIGSVFFGLAAKAAFF